MVNDHNRSRQVSLLLHVLSKLIHQVADSDLIKQSTDLPLSKRQFEILKILFVSGAFSVSDLAKFLMISRPAASKSVNNLVKYELVQRSIPSLDRRKVMVSILPKGEKIVDHYFDISRRREEQILSQFDDEELVEFQQILSRYVESLMEKYKREVEIVCLTCNVRFSHPCPLSTGGLASCYHTIVEAPAEVL